MEHSSHVESGFLLLEIAFDEQNKYTYFGSVEKNSPEKLLLNFYMIEGYPEDLNGLVFEILAQLQNPEFDI
jgi:hypothetical protein